MKTELIYNVEHHDISVMIDGDLWKDLTAKEVCERLRIKMPMVAMSKYLRTVQHDRDTPPEDETHEYLMPLDEVRYNHPDVTDDLKTTALEFALQYASLTYPDATVTVE